MASKVKQTTKTAQLNTSKISNDASKKSTMKPAKEATKQPKTKKVESTNLAAQQQQKAFADFIAAKQPEKSQLKKLDALKKNETSAFTMPLRTQNLHDNQDMIISTKTKNLKATISKNIKSNKPPKKLDFAQIKKALEQISQKNQLRDGAPTNKIKIEKKNTTKTTKKSQSERDSDDRKRAYSHQEEMQLERTLGQITKSNNDHFPSKHHQHPTAQTLDPVATLQKQVKTKTTSKIAPAITPNSKKKTSKIGLVH